MTGGVNHYRAANERGLGLARSRALSGSASDSRPNSGRRGRSGRRCNGDIRGVARPRVDLAPAFRAIRAHIPGALLACRNSRWHSRCSWRTRLSAAPILGAGRAGRKRDRADRGREV